MADSKLTETIIAAQKGDNAAFELLCGKYAKEVYFLALKLLNNTQNAEEITQDVFLTVYQKISQLNSPEAFHKWLKVIVANKCSNFLRKTNALTVSGREETTALEFTEETDRALIPAQSLDNAANAQIIVEIIDELPLPQRVCVYYYYYEELSIAEIAEQLGISESTVKSRLALAREKIRVALEKLEKDDGIKLYTALPLLFPLLKTAAENTVVPASVTTLASAITNGTAATVITATAGTAATTTTVTAGTAATTTTATAGTAATTATTTAKAAISIKTIAATAAGVAIVAGGIVAGVVLTKPTEPASVEVSAYEEVYFCFNAGSDEMLARYVADGTIPQNVTHLDMQNNQITDITPLAGLTNLWNIVLLNNQITDITPLVGLPYLTWLSLTQNQITDITLLAEMTNLEHLGLYGNPITDITPLTELTNLRNLELSIPDNITDISLFAGLPNLTWLSLHGTQPINITPLAGLTNLETLELSRFQITDITPLAGLTNLERLRLSSNQITDITPLAGLVNLTELKLSFNQITDITPLAGLTNLEQLDLWGNPITDWSPVAHVANVSGRP